MTISVTTGTLTAGTHSGQVSLWPTGAPSVTVPVSFTVTAPPLPPALGASPTSLSYTATQGGSNPSTQSLSISNTGGGTLTWSASDNATWLTLSPGPGPGPGNGTVTLSAVTGALAVGSHSGIVTLSATGASPVTVPVTVTVIAAPTITLSPSSLSYAATQGAANPVNQNVSLANSGGTLNWTVSDDASWLTVSPASGSGSSTLTTIVNTAGLTAQTYTGTLTVSAVGATSITVAVTLTVNASATSSVTLTWNANTESDLAGYKIYRATTAGGYGAPIATLQGNVTTFIASGLQVGTTHFFVITAYDSAVNESVRSNEVSKSITRGEKTIHRLSHTKEGLFMEIAKIVLVSFRTVVKQGPLGILSLIVAVAGLLIFHVAGTAGTGLLEDHKIIFLAAIVGLTIVFVVTLLLIMVWDRRKR